MDKSNFDDFDAQRKLERVRRLIRIGKMRRSSGST
jgi:hypothetical protein